MSKNFRKLKNEIDEFDDSENLEIIIARGHDGNQLETVVLVSDISCPTWDKCLQRLPSSSKWLFFMGICLL